MSARGSSGATGATGATDDPVTGRRGSVVDIKHEPDGSKALDATIELFSGQDMVDLGKAKHRQQLKEELLVYLEEEYHGDVMGVYFTEFVTQ